MKHAETANIINTRKKAKDGYVAMARVSIVPIGRNTTILARILKKG